jgi:hypothetical protein
VRLSRLFLGKGRLPADLRAELEGEGIQQLAEELFGTITLRGYKAPHERSSTSKQAFRGAIAITRKRLVVWSGSRMAAPWFGTQVNVAFDDPRYRSLEISAERNDRLLIATRLEEFHPDRSGRFEIRLRTPKAVELAEFALAAR